MRGLPGDPSPWYRRGIARGVHRQDKDESTNGGTTGGPPEDPDQVWMIMTITAREATAGTPAPAWQSLRDDSPARRRAPEVWPPPGAEESLGYSRPEGFPPGCAAPP
jgi:hypothetical protein